VELPLRAGADKNANKKPGSMPLNHAAGNGHEESVELLLRAGADNNRKSTMSRSPIQDAAYSGRAQCLKLLLRAGADKNPKKKKGRMPLQLAVGNRHIKCRILLLRAGAIEVTKNESLSSAAAVGRTACVEQLPRAGAENEKKTCNTNWRRCTTLLIKVTISALSFCWELALTRAHETSIAQRRYTLLLQKNTKNARSCCCAQALR
jgi:ankyrin repeat protein